MLCKAMYDASQPHYLDFSTKTARLSRRGGMLDDLINSVPPGLQFASSLLWRGTRAGRRQRWTQNRPQLRFEAARSHSKLLRHVATT